MIFKTTALQPSKLFVLGLISAQILMTPPTSSAEAKKCAEALRANNFVTTTEATSQIRDREIVLSLLNEAADKAAAEAARQQELQNRPVLSFDDYLGMRRGSPLEILEADYAKTAVDVAKFYKRNYEGRNLVVFTDASWDQKSGVITVMKVLQQKVKEMTGMNVVYVTPESFKLHFNTGYQDIRVSQPLKSEIMKYLKEYNPAAIHIMVEGSVGFNVKKILDKNNVPYTSAYHTDFPKYAAAIMPLKILRSFIADLGYKIMRFFHQRSDRIMAPTQSMANILIDNKFNPNKIAKWSHGVEEKRFTPEFRDQALFQRILNERVEAGTVATRVREIKGPISLFVGRIEPEKNLHNFLDMKVPGTKIFIGDGTSRKSLEKKYPDAIFLGKMPYEDLPKFYASADVFVFTSLTDTFGLVMLEAAATGTPVLAYSVQGPVDVIRDPRAGVLVKYDGKDPVGNLKRLEDGFTQALALKRNEVRDYAAKNPWDKSIIEFLYFLHPLTQEQLAFSRR